MLEFLTKEKCAGCAACVSVCPQNCLDMVTEPDGFQYPQMVTTNCFHCGLCEKVCPVLHKPVFPHVDPTAGALRTLNETAWKNSSSGGAFYELSKLFLALHHDRGVVFASRFDGLHLVHDCFETITEILPFQKSKYLQSDIRGVYSRIKWNLSNCKSVLFFGTPCQVAGLRNYLNSDCSELVCVDFVCHGVGSPGFFQSYISYLENNRDKKVVRYEFRTKKGILGNFERYCSKISYGDGTEEYINGDSYNIAFLKQLCTRKICNGDCPFREIPRQGDITIADLNAKSIVFPDLCDEKNYSAIVYNTEKGKAFQKALAEATNYYDCDLNQIIQFNPLICGNLPGNPGRDGFMENYANGLEYTTLLSAAGIGQKQNKNLQNLFIDLIPWKVKFRIHRLFRNTSRSQQKSGK